MQRAWLCLGVVLMGSVQPGAQGRQQERQVPAESRTVAAAYALIAPDVADGPVRTDIRYEGATLVLRVTRTDPEAERRRVPRPAAPALEARLTRTVTGDLRQLVVTGAVTDRPAVRVAASATDGAKTDALRRARYGADATEAMRARAVERAAALAPDAAAGEARLVWAPVGAELEAQWVVRVAVTTPRGPQMYRARFTADGALMALDREEGR